MQQVSTSIVIPAPIQQLFAQLINVADNPRWISSVTSMELMDVPPMRAGFRFRETGGFLWVHVTDEKRVHIFEPPHQFGFEGQFLRNSTVYSLEPTNQGTKVTVTLTGTPPRGTPKLVQRRVLAEAAKRIARDLQVLGDLLPKTSSQ